MLCYGSWFLLIDKWYPIVRASLVKNPPAMQETQFDSWVRKIPGGGIGYPLQYSWASLAAQTVKNPPGRRETWVRSLGWEDPLEKGKATHSSILVWRIPMYQRNLAGHSPWVTESDSTE